MTHFGIEANHGFYYCNAFKQVEWQIEVVKHSAESEKKYYIMMDEIDEFNDDEDGPVQIGNNTPWSETHMQFGAKLEICCSKQ